MADVLVLDGLNGVLCCLRDNDLAEIAMISSCRAAGTYTSWTVAAVPVQLVLPCEVQPPLSPSEAQPWKEGPRPLILTGHLALSSIVLQVRRPAAPLTRLPRVSRIASSSALLHQVVPPSKFGSNPDPPVSSTTAQPCLGPNMLNQRTWMDLCSTSAASPEATMHTYRYL